MEQLIKKIDAILAQNFPGIDVALVTKRGVPRIGGFVIWAGFTGQPQLERQSLIWKVLKASLNQDEELKIGTILTVTPQEVAAMKEVAVAA